MTEATFSSTSVMWSRRSCRTLRGEEQRCSLLSLEGEFKLCVLSRDPCLQYEEGPSVDVRWSKITCLSA
eukprot:2650674-Amphidinium_carterae.2